MYELVTNFFNAWQTFLGNALIKYVFQGIITPAATNAGGQMVGLIAQGAQTTAEVMMSMGGMNLLGGFGIASGTGGAMTNPVAKG